VIPIAFFAAITPELPQTLPGWFLVSTQMAADW
jgi:hypothetical protein